MSAQTDPGNFRRGTVQLWDNILEMGSSVKRRSAEAVWMVLALRSCLSATESAL